MRVPVNQQSNELNAGDAVISISILEMETAGLLTSVAPHKKMWIGPLIASGNGAGVRNLLADCNGDCEEDCQDDCDPK